MEELERMLELFLEKECPNINSAFRKLHANLVFRSARAMVPISGGADSDMMLDMIMALDPAKNYPFNEMHYVWFDTGIEYTATKQHLKNLEEKYGITIERRRAETPVPIRCKTWGQPFMSKQISQYISRLQTHGFLRTGCACCPFGSRFEQELQTADQLDPGLAKAARNIFGAAYEYTRAYRQFKAQYDAEKKSDKDQFSMFEDEI